MEEIAADRRGRSRRDDMLRYSCVVICIGDSGGSAAAGGGYAGEVTATCHAGPAGQ